MNGMHRALAALLALALVAPLSRGYAEDPLDFDGLTRREVSGATAEDPRERDRAMVLFLASHLRQVDAEIERARSFQIDVVRDAQEYVALLEERKRAAEEARRKANARAARNALFSLAGAEAETIDLMNSIDDVSDALSADTEAERAAVRRRVYTPLVGSLLLGADTEDLNTLRTFDNVGTALSSGRRARDLGEALEHARQGVRDAELQAERVGEHVARMEEEKTRALELLDEMSARYLGEVNRIVAGVPGFAETFGRVHDLAFTNALDVPDDQPLILALTFAIPVPDRDEPEVVDVRLREVREMVEDRFETLVQQRQARVERLEADLEELRRGVDDAHARRERIRAQIATQRRHLDATSRWKVVTRSRISGEIERLEGELRHDRQPQTLAEGIRAKEDELAAAERLLARARSAQQLFGRVDAAAALQAVREIEALL